MKNLLNHIMIAYLEMIETESIYQQCLTTKIKSFIKLG